MKNERSLLCRYISFITVASTISAAIVITVEATTNRNTFDLADRQYAYYFRNYYEEGERLPIGVILRFANYLIWLFIQLLLVAIILVLYFLTTKQCCAKSSISRDFRVSIILIATADLNAVITITLLMLDIPKQIIPSIPFAVVAVEQFALLTLFATSSKVTFCCCMEERKQYSTSSK